MGLGVLGGAWVAGHRAPASATFLQRTFRSEAIYNARFAPDGRTIVYSSAAETSAPALFLVRPDYPEPKALDLTGTHLLAVSSKGELAVLLRAAFVRHRLFVGTLARVPLAGGAPREVLDSVREADWSPDGSELAIIHDVNGRDRLEFPIGKVLYQGSGYLSDPRVSPDGRYLAFAEHPFRWDDRGTVKIVDRAASRWPSAGTSRPSKAWPGGPGAMKVLFSAYDSSGFVVRALDLDGRQRLALTGAGNLTTQDISRSGQLLLTRDDAPYRMLMRGPRRPRELNVSWLDASIGPKLSRDGSLLAFTNGGFDASVYYDVMLRKTEGGEATQPGRGPGRRVLAGREVAAGLRLHDAAEARPLSHANRRRAVGSPSIASSPSGRPTGSPTAARSSSAGTGSGKLPGAGSSPSRGERRGRSPRRERAADSSRRTVRRSWRSLRPWVTAGIRSPEEAAARFRGLSSDDQVVRWSPDGRALVVGSATSRTLDRVDLATGPPGAARHPRNRASRSPGAARLLHDGGRPSRLRLRRRDLSLPGVHRGRVR